jgi:hypothetical protein
MRLAVADDCRSVMATSAKGDGVGDPLGTTDPQGSPTHRLTQGGASECGEPFRDSRRWKPIDPESLNTVDHY